MMDLLNSLLLRQTSSSSSALFGTWAMVGISLLCDFIKLILIKGQLGEIFSRLDALEAYE